MLKTRNQLEQLESQHLAPYASKSIDSKGRKHEEARDDYRLEFQRDRDRIIHSAAFRRLKDKTQVFVPSESDHYRNRLTHTVEVAQLSRDMARSLCVNEDLAETIALGHDLGHTPFGHAGEETLNTLMKQHGDRFEHNCQSKRIVELLEHPYAPQFAGLNLTWETLDGLDKHQSAYDQADANFKENLSLEAQIVNLCDELAYQNHDTEDGLRSGIIQSEQLENISLWKKVQSEMPFKADILKNRRPFINELIKIMVHDVYTQTQKNIEKNNITTIDDIYRCSETLVGFSEEMKQMNDELRKFLYENLYFSSHVVEKTKHGQHMIETLFEHYIKNPSEKILALQESLQETKRHVVVKDYIAGMTDVYAEKKFYEIQEKW